MAKRQKELEQENGHNQNHRSGSRDNGTIWGRPELTAYIVLFLACIILVLFIGATEKPSYLSARKKKGTTALTDYTVTRVQDPNAPQGYYDLYTMKLTQSFNGEVYLAYRMVHEYTQVFVSGEIIYAIDRPNSNFFGKTVGNCWAMVPLFGSDYGRTIQIRIYPVYAGNAYVPSHFLIGERSEIIGEETVANLPAFILSLIALILGLLYVVSSRSRLVSQKATGVELRCLGVFAMLLAVWRLCDMPVASLLLPRLAVMLSYVTLLSLMLMPVPMILYLWSRLRLSRRAAYVMCTGFLVLDSVILILQLANVMDIRENLLLIHGSDAAALILIMVSILWVHQKRKTRLSVNVNPLVVLVMIAGVAGDLVQYYWFNREPDLIFTLIGVDFYIIVSGIYYLLKLRRDASVDTATGIFNKNRCEEVIAAGGEAERGTMFIMCDLNGLKRVNDTFGHEAGDRMIADFAAALKETYSRDRDFVGRFGGDEFIVILENVENHEEARQQLERLRFNVDKLHGPTSRVPMSYSSGYSLAVDNPGEDLEFLLRKADMEMYLQKKAWHDAHPSGLAGNS